MKNNNVRNLTYGASISAIYIVIILIARSLGQLYIDSPIFFLLPVPVALYTFKYGLKYGLMVFFVTSLATVLIEPTIGLILVSTATFSGAIYGYLESKFKNTFIKGGILFIIFILVDLLVTYVGGKLFGYDLIKDTKKMAEDTFQALNSALINYDVKEEVLVNILVGLIPFVIVLSDFIRTIFTMLIFDMIALRLKMKNDAPGLKKLYLKINPVHTFAFLFLFIIDSYFLRLLYQDSSVFIMVLFNITLFLSFIYGLLIMISALNFLIYYLKIENKTNRILFTFLALLLFPLTIFIGLFINVLFYKSKR